MGEALWIRRGTLARMACETILNRRCIAPPYPPLARHLDLRILKHSLFLRFYSYFCENVHGARPQHTTSVPSPNRRGALNMHETQATATLASSTSPATLKHAET